MLSDKLARLEYLLLQNSGNASSALSKDEGPGKTPPEKVTRGKDGVKRKRGKQPGAAGANLVWAESPDDHLDRFPQGRCGCGAPDHQSHRVARGHRRLARGVEYLGSTRRSLAYS